jgi:hypothetical protein
MIDPAVAILVSTHDRVDDARINMEIIRASWSDAFDRIAVVHAYNGPPAGWTQYLEDLVIEVPPSPSHFTGAADLLDAGLAAVAQEYPDIRHVVCLASDSWLYRPERLRAVVDDMRQGELRLAAASWEVADYTHGVRRERGDPELLPGAGLSTDFFVLDLPWALEYGLLPLQLGNFLTENSAMLNYLQEVVLLEKFFEGQFLRATRLYLQRTGRRKDGWGSEGLRQARRLLLLLRERRIDPSGCTAPQHKGHWPELGLITIEDPIVKRAEMLQVPDLRGGPVLRRLLSGEDTNWFNCRKLPSGMPTPEGCHAQPVQAQADRSVDSPPSSA